MDLGPTSGAGLGSLLKSVAIVVTVIFMVSTFSTGSSVVRFSAWALLGPLKEFIDRLARDLLLEVDFFVVGILTSVSG